LKREKFWSGENVRGQQSEVRGRLLGFALKTFGNQYLLKKPSLLLIIYLEKGRYASFPDSFENRGGDLSTQFACSKVLLFETQSGRKARFVFIAGFFKRHLLLDNPDFDGGLHFAV
jgi:hypothetical protein